MSLPKKPKREDYECGCESYDDHICSACRRFDEDNLTYYKAVAEFAVSALKDAEKRTRRDCSALWVDINKALEAIRQTEIEEAK